MSQKIEKFTVAILDNNNNPVGTGFIVSDSGIIVTAYHVIITVVEERIINNSHIISIKFPYSQIISQGKLLVNNSKKEYDIAFIKVDYLPQNIPIARFGYSDNSIGNIFVSCGYRNPQGGAVGRIAPKEMEPTKLQYERLILKSDQIDKGMSGAPVLDIDNDIVIGIVVATWYPDNNISKDRETAFAMPSEAIVELLPSIKISNTYINKQHSLIENLPQKKTEKFYGRKKITKELLQLIDNNSQRILITGISGIGKTTFVLEVAYKLIDLKLFNSIFWFSSEIQTGLTLDIILDTIATLYEINVLKSIDINKKIIRINKLLQKNKVLIILDGYELFSASNISQFIKQLPRKCQIITISRNSIAIPEENIIHLNKLDMENSVAYILNKSQNKRLQNADTDTLNEIYHACEGVPLALDWLIGQINLGNQTVESAVNSIVSSKVDTVYNVLFGLLKNELNDTDNSILNTIALSIGTISKKALSYICSIKEEKLNKSLSKLATMG